MHFQYINYIWVLLVSAAITAVLGIYAWRHRAVVWFEGVGASGPACESGGNCPKVQHLHGQDYAFLYLRLYFGTL